MKKTIFILSLSILTLSAFAQKTYQLKQNYPVGKKYSFEVISDQIIEQEASGQKINLVQNLGTIYTMEFNKGTALGNTDIKTTYERIYMKQNSMGQETSVDSDVSTPGQQNPFSGIKGATVNMQVSPKGEIINISGTEKVIHDLAIKMATDSATIVQVKAALSKQLSVEAIKQSMESSFKIYPTNAVKVGDTWTINYKVNTMMPLETENIFTLKEVKDGIATLLVKGKLISKGTFEVGGMQMETDLTGISTGDLQVNATTGIISASYQRLELEGLMKTMGTDIHFKMEGINQVKGKALN